MTHKPDITYGGQAVLEGVMIRGARCAAVAVRKPDGEIGLRVFELGSLYSGSFRKIPLIRGILVLAETLTLGMRALTHSANVAIGEQEEELGKGSVAGVVAFSVTFAVGIFFIFPVFASRWLDGLLGSDIITNLVEGVIRLGVFLAYITLISRMNEIRRVFMYHGAEHMTVHALEQGDPLVVSAVRKYTTAHPRCGTAFLLTVMVVAIIVLTFIGRDPLWWLIVSRVIFIPLIAAISYEIIRYSGMYSQSPLMRTFVVPGLMLQKLTTRKPDDDQIEVAIAAMKLAIETDNERAANAAVL